MSNFTTYWDLEEKERAALTREEVERFLDAELMTKGVLKVSPLVLDEEPEIVEPVAATFYQVGPVAFTTADGAEAFLKLGAVTIETKYLGGGYRNTVSVAVPIEREACEKRLVTASEYAARKGDLDRRQAARDANAKRREEHESATKEQDKVLGGVWEDWYRCRNVDEAHRKVVATFNNYVTTAGGSALTAARFLGKVFTFEAIDEARKWCGVAIPDADGPEYVPSVPEAQPVGEQDLTF